MHTLGVPGPWHVGPSTRPTDLGERLLAHGFEYGGNDIGMAVDLATLPERVAAPEGFAAEMGYGAYRRLGFEERRRIGLYEWQPGG
jgi:hypothetical protein